MPLLFLCPKVRKESNMKLKFLLVPALCAMISFGMGFISTANLVPALHTTVAYASTLHVIPRDLAPLELPVQKWESLAVPSAARAFKAQESYRALTNKTSMQYEMQRKAWTDSDGFRRYGDEGYYMVAMGSYYVPNCGTVLRVTLDTGKTFMAIGGDQKADCHTDAKNQYCLGNGSLVEFIVDLDKINSESRKRGDMSYSAGMNGKVVKVERLVTQ